jgi:CheY-like chemotaxis protein
LEPFFTTKEVGEGSGLGLAMIYGFVRQSGGHVAIYSEKGHGTTVKLFLPRTAEQSPSAGEETVIEAPGARGETVLVVEDNADVRQLAVDLLEGLGYRVLQAPDGWAALSVVEASAPPDLLLSDVVLPGGLSGPDLAKRVLELYPGLNIIFMSGYPADAPKLNDFLGSDKVLLSKPFSRHQLAKALREALG